MSLILVTGGVQSGKSAWAEQRARELSEASGGNVTFLATAEVKDMEMRLRIAQFRKTRPRTWKTIEATRSIAAELLRKAKLEPGSVLIVDCITMLVNNIMTNDTANTDPARVEQAVQSELRAVLRIIKERKATVIMVTTEMGGASGLENDSSKNYREIVGRLNQWLSTQADGVWLTVSGMALPLHNLASPIIRNGQG